MFSTVLIANRGEIAVRIARTLKRMGIRSVAIYSDADADSLHVAVADIAIPLGGQTPAESYLRGDRIIEIARETGAEAIIPGYGFLSENTEFAEQCAAAGIAFVGPTPDQIRRFGLKHTSREIAKAAGVPLTPGTDLLKDVAAAKAAAAEIGYPVMLKSTAGGGGIGLQRCADEGELVAAFDSVKRLGQSFFKDGGVFIERFVSDARHVEVQIFGDGRGNVVALGERDCSVQRRNQKVIEETPAPGLPPETRRRLLDAAVRLGQAVGYVSAGTVEFIYDGARNAFYFLEVNTRLQVEHPVTEAVTGLDLVEWMIRIAAGDPPDFSHLPEPQGASIEVRLYAENPVRNFAPSPGTLTEVFFPEGVRVDGWVRTGTEVSANYDPMIAKLIVHGPDREAARLKMLAALDATRLHGIATNLDYLRGILSGDTFINARMSTRFLDSYHHVSPVVEVLEPGTYTTVQDYPGRHGYWDIGVPPSGPMDDYAFRLANRIVGNDAAAAGLECTLQGPTLRFHGDAIIALTGGAMPASLDGGEALSFWTPISVKAGQVLRLGRAESGCRTYIAIRNGLDVPDYLGSKSTFVLGQFGGHAGRTLRVGDVLPVSRPGAPACTTPAPTLDPSPAPASLIPAYSKHWDIAVLYGPHGAPDFFKSAAMEAFFSSDYRVHHNSNRLGVRLVGPKPEWTRSDGGEAGLHPSNIHDCVYAIGSINFTGDTPVILTCDGPSLGGFVCPATIIKADLWKVGQVKPGDTIRFRPVSFADALALERAQDAAIAGLDDTGLPVPAVIEPDSCILTRLPASGDRPMVTYRQAGDKYILLEYGENVLDLRLRLRIHLLMEALTAARVPGVAELSPGVRSVQIHYDSRVIHQDALVATLLTLEEGLGAVAGLKVPSRIVHLPMAFEDSATLGAVTRYQETVKADAPWLPNNVDFIQRINGLERREQVHDTIFDASYMVLGLGDVYLGAPCAVPLDPRHRLLTSKYNPARTYTAEGTVGIGGVYMCIYGMDSPGGYQLVGRTVPIWNKFLANRQFGAEPWLLRFFDRVRFYPVTEPELDRFRADFRAGRAQVAVEDSVFDLEAHEAAWAAEADDIAAFRARQQAAFTAEVARWQTDDAVIAAEADAAPAVADENAIQADISGNVWKVLVEVGQQVEPGQTLVVLEAMKMEFTIQARCAGRVGAVHCRAGRSVTAGDALLSMEVA
ncbi:urea carboxylase [Niveispirillum cyanobacteriorum]|uniref:Urea carboxylase n=1 Tax=Niveispirillum cyanobacteriorum TaxID=1612173 RepID=A0A2K9NK40_9PROT|nr:urea carboxylase [Niveispirillum cyanobacteriorum]AUN33450.1 urea carboxylase [Niveispirillum cyanobacteriorum]GGE48477.1 urea carboxylase [Niveispirillum cyanobacteriorum]